MTVLITGANGGFGRAFVPLVRTRYDEPIIGVGKSGIESSEYIKCDLTDEKVVARLIKNHKPRLIFHLAGSFTGQFDTDFQINTLSAKYIFDSIAAEGLSSRVVIIGSAAEYGVVRELDNPIPETFPCCPISVYGLTKLYQTEMAMFVARANNLDVLVARVFNLAMQGLSPRLFYGRAEAMISAYQRKEISQLVFGNLDSERDYIGFEKASDQIFAIADYGNSGEIYNVGSGVPKKVRAILAELMEENDIPWCNVVEKKSEEIGRSGFDVPVIYANIIKVSKLMRFVESPISDSVNVDAISQM